MEFIGSETKNILVLTLVKRFLFFENKIIFIIKNKIMSTTNFPTATTESHEPRKNFKNLIIGILAAALVGTGSRVYYLHQTTPRENNCTGANTNCYCN